VIWQRGLLGGLRAQTEEWLARTHGGPPSQRFVATGSVQLLESLRLAAPNHVLIAADFDALPPPSGISHTHADTALNAPIVSSAGGKVDHGSYLQNAGNADIFFATDFRWLASAYSAVMGPNASATVLSSDSFLSRNVNPRRTETRTGYNPMLEDYTNTAFLIAKSRSNLWAAGPTAVAAAAAAAEPEAASPTTA
jgi:hypothetical protein